MLWTYDHSLQYELVVWTKHYYYCLCSFFTASKQDKAMYSRPQMRALAHETAPAKAKMRGGPYIYIGWKWHRIIKKLFYSFIDNLYVSALQKDVSSMNAKPPVCEGGGAIMHGLKPAISSRRQSHFINLWYHA
jgi:hypothetical protein